MGLLDANPQLDGMTLGLLGAGQALMLPRSRGGGIGGAGMAFGQGLLQGEELMRARAAQANRDRLTQAQIGHYESDAEYRRGLLDEKRRATDAVEAQRMAQQQAAEAQAQARAAFVNAYRQSGGRWSPDLTILATNAGIKGEDLERFAKGGNLGQSPLTWQNGLGLDPITGQPRATAPDVNKPFFPTLVDGRVGAAPNSAVQNFETSKARAGAPSVSLKVENKMGESVGAQVGPMLRDSTTAADGAVKMADSAVRALDAIEKGGVIAGPTATLRMRGAQIASMLGIGGKDAVAQTRQVIRSLAESSVEARKELQGQGQVTESEAKAVQKAMSGDIDDMTVEEIRDVLRLNIRAAVARVQSHQQRLQAMPESMGAARPFYEVRGADSVLQIDPSRYSIRPPAGANVAPDGKSASGAVGGAPAQRVMKFDKNGNLVP